MLEKSEAQPERKTVLVRESDQLFRVPPCVMRQAGGRLHRTYLAQHKGHRKRMVEPAGFRQRLVHARVPDRCGPEAPMSTPSDPGSLRTDRPPLWRCKSRERPDLSGHHTAREGRALSQTPRESSNWRRGYSDPAAERHDLF